MAKQTRRQMAPRWGIGEWYGTLYERMSPSERTKMAAAQLISPGAAPNCPFQAQTVKCRKSGGVCTLKQYFQTIDDREQVCISLDGQLVTTCPKRFEEGGEIYRWVAEELLQTDSPIVIGEVGFLESTTGESEVGQIDNILIHPSASPMQWCGMEIQAVYFSGGAMMQDFKAIAEHQGEDAVFPKGFRRPDFRSSGPKRLLPQLQVKVPTLRRWGKKMAVVVDEQFFGSMARMTEARDVTNADVVWFVVGYGENNSRAQLERRFRKFTTLESAVDGLNASREMTQDEFEKRIKIKARLVTP